MSREILFFEEANPNSPAEGPSSSSVSRINRPLLVPRSCSVSLGLISRVFMRNTEQIRFLSAPLFCLTPLYDVLSVAFARCAGVKFAGVKEKKKNPRPPGARIFAVRGRWMTQSKFKYANNGENGVCTLRDGG